MINHHNKLNNRNSNYQIKNSKSFNNLLKNNKIFLHYNNNFKNKTKQKIVRVINKLALKFNLMYTNINTKNLIRPLY